MKAFDPPTVRGLLAVAPLLGLAVNAAAQLLLGRLPLGFGHVRRQFLSFGLGLLATAAALTLLLPRAGLGPWDRAGSLALHGLSYAFLGFLFFNVINLNISSLRIRMLKEFLRQHPRPLADEALLEKYHVGAMLDARLERLASGRQIELRDGRYHARRGAVVRIGHFFAGLRAFLLPE